MVDASAAAGSVTIEEYLAGRFDKDLEFVDGKLEPRTGFGWTHARTLTEVGAWFWARRAEWAVDALCSYWVMTSPTRVRMPDLCVVRKGEAEKVRVSPPLLVIEILAAEDRPETVIKRLDDFVAMGVENIWILDPNNGSAATYSRDGMKQLNGTRLELPDTPIYVDVRVLFAAGNES